jgi:hypothetical protein
MAGNVSVQVPAPPPAAPGAARAAGAAPPTSGAGGEDREDGDEMAAMEPDAAAMQAEALIYVLCACYASALTTIVLLL